jgi:hypothetical protein
MKKTFTVLFAAFLLAAFAPMPALAAPPPMETKLIVDSFRTDKPAALPGESCTLTIRLRNTNAKQYARNITVTARPADGALLCVEKNTLYIGRLNAGKAAECAFTLKAAATAEAGVHMVALGIKYEDGNGMQLDLQAEAPVEVAEPGLPAPRMLADIPEAPAADADAPVTVKTQVHNLGRGTLYNLSATASGAHLKLVKNDYGGNLESGQSMALELVMAFDDGVKEAVKKSDAWKGVKPGGPAPVLEYPARLTLTYEDESGREYTQTLDFPAKANIPRPDEPAYAVPAQQAAKASAPDVTGWVVAGIALVAAACAVALALWKARGRRDAR